MRKKYVVVMAVCMSLLLMFSGLAGAFSDIQGNKAEKEIIALKDAGIISGVDEHTFAPEAELSYAAGVHLIVKGLGLNINTMLTNKELKASQMFTQVADDAWYASSFIIAQMNGLAIDKEVDPNQSMTREQFSHLLFQGIMLKGDYAFIEIFKLIKDEQDVNTKYMNSVQKLLISNIVELEDGSFYPKRIMNRGETAQMLHKAIEFVKARGEQVKPEPMPIEELVKLEIVKVNDDVNRITLIGGEKPNAGYRIELQSITFAEETSEAVISYKWQYPVEGQAYAQVITYPKAETFLAAKYKVSLYDAGQSQGQGQGQGQGHDPGEGSVPSGKLRGTIELTYDYEGELVTEEAHHWAGQNDYYLYVPERLTATQEEPNKDIIMTKEAPESTMRIEVLNDAADIEEQKIVANDQLKAGYPNMQPTVVNAEGDPFFEKAYYQAGSFNDTSATTIYLIPIDGKNFKITVHVWKSEEWAIPVFNEVIQTIGTKAMIK